MRSAKSYIRDTGDFLNKLKELGSIPQNALLVTVDVVGLHPSIPHQDSLDALSIKLENEKIKRFLRRIYLKWPSLYLKKITLNSTQKLSSKYLVRPLELSLLLRTHVSLWIGWKQSF